MTTRNNKSDRTLSTGLVDAQTSVRLLNPIGDDVFSITSGPIQFADSFTVPESPDVSIKLFTGAVDVPVANIDTEFTTFIYLNKDLEVTQETELKRGAFLRDHVGVGIITHADNLVIDNFSEFTPVSQSGQLMGFSDLSSTMGPINGSFGGRNIISGVSGTLELEKSSGEYNFHAINSRDITEGNKNPNVIPHALLSSPPIIQNWTTTDDPSGSSIIQVGTIPGLYDDGTAVMTDSLPQGTVGENEWVNHRIFVAADFTNILALQFGVRTYSSKLAARQGLSSEIFNTVPGLLGVTAQATLTVRGGATDLDVDINREIRQALAPRGEFI